MSDELFGALIGASAAVLVQIVAIIAQILVQKRQLSLQERQFAHTSKEDLRKKKLDALVSIREHLLCYSDDDVDALSTHRAIRPLLIFVDDSLERQINEAILSNVRNSRFEKSEKLALGMIQDTIQKIKTLIE